MTELNETLVDHQGDYSSLWEGKDCVSFISWQSSQSLSRHKHNCKPFSFLRGIKQQLGLPHCICEVSFILGYSPDASLFFQDTFLLPSPDRNRFSGLTWHLGLSAINSSNCKYQTAWLWYCDYDIVFSFSLVSPESALTQAESSSRISSPVVGIFTHITAQHHSRDLLSHTLWLILFQSSGGHTAQSRKILRNDNKLSNADYVLQTQITHRLVYY